MRFVEAVSGKGFHLFVNMGGNFFGNIIGFAPFHKFLAKFFHNVQFLFTHGFAQGVGLAGGKPAQRFGNLHDLFLVHHTAVSVF